MPPINKYTLAMIILLTITTQSSSETNINSTKDSKRKTRQNFTVSTANKTIFPFSGSEITTSQGQRLRYYYSNSSSAEMPLVIFLPGSGCTGAFPQLRDGSRAMGPEAFALKFSRDIRLVVTENPGIEERFAQEDIAGCSATFKSMENLQARLESFQAIIADLRDRDWINHPFMIVAGSEGVALATRFASISRDVSHLFLISGFGIGEPLATVHAALTGWGNWNFISSQESRNSAARLQDTLDRWKQVHQNREKINGEMIAGHSERYWSSIGMASPAEDALETRASLYLVQGGRDTSAPSVNFEAGIAYLVAHGRPFVSEYVQCGDHFLMCPDDRGSPDNLQKVVSHGMDWFLTGQVPQSSVALFDPANES